MLKFSDYLGSNILNEAAMKSGIGDKDTPRHINKYLNQKLRDEHEYTVAKDGHPLFAKGSKVTVTGEARLPRGQEKKGHYHVDVDNGEHVGSVPLSYLQKPSIGRANKDQEKLENSQISHLHTSIQHAITSNKGKPITMHVGEGKTVRVAGIQKVTEGKPKADSYLHDENGTPVHWMSLKGRQFQQFGGTRGLEDHPVMKQALHDLAGAKDTFHGDSPTLPSGHAYHFQLDKNDPNHADLIHKEMYGIDHGKEHGINNVHAVYGGETIGIKPHTSGRQGHYEFNPEAVYSNMKNNHKSDVADAKVLVTPREGKNQHGTGGRVMVAPTYLSPNSRDATDAMRTGLGYVKKQKAPAVSKAKKSKSPITSEGHGDHGGLQFNGPSEMPQ